ncbi:MAG: hypothetical protein RML35_09230 [Chloroherpetonaceae bacterium]|nr:hypothetical protein [Chloroherpetonaceae bacterium]
MRCSAVVGHYLCALLLLTTESAFGQYQAQPAALPKPLLARQDSVFADEPTALPAQKSSFLAVLLSFALPGIGEVYAERFDVGQYFLAADVALLVGFVALTVYGNVQRADYQSYARLYANISGDKSEEFWRDIADWQNREAFNQFRLQRRQYALIYGPADDWQWVSEAHRLRYREMRISSETAFQAGYYVLAAMGLNRLLSAINAARLVNAAKGEIGANTHVQPCFSSSVQALPDGLLLSVRATF